MADALPPLSEIAFKDTKRLIPAKSSINEESVLTRLAPNTEVLQDGFEVESRTNDRLIADVGGLPGITPHELVANVPYASIINAAFTHARPEGSRFNGPDRDAWYAAKSVKTSQAEVSHHQTLALSEVARYKDEITCDESMADFIGEFHDLIKSPKFAAALDPDSYKASLRLAAELLEKGSLGIVYPSVRAAGVCLVCFRPALVTGVPGKFRTKRIRDSKNGSPVGDIKPSHDLRADRLRS
jgi:RES domain-containing protein